MDAKMKFFLVAYACILISLLAFAQNKEEKKLTQINPKLTQEEQRIIVRKGTEVPFTGEFYKHKEDGIYVCKNCGTELFDSKTKFESGSGWPSFDDSIKGAVKEVPDKDGRRTEIVCANCGAHLGHVFRGEEMTTKDTRHCVNSVSLSFKKETQNINKNTKFAYFAGGCFWGVEYHFEKQNGVLDAVSGYMGGKVQNPTYHDVCYKNTGHLEVVRVEYDPVKISYEALAKLFFEIHDPTQKNGQGPDIGSQYLSAVFYNDSHELEILNNLAKILNSKNYNIATKFLEAKPHKFYEAEGYHQDYYTNHAKQPYCHNYTKRF